MLDGIERNSTQHSRGRVSTTVRHPGVRRFVHADREQENDQLKQDVNMLQGHQTLKLILTCEAGNATSSGSSSKRQGSIFSRIVVLCGVEHRWMCAQPRDRAAEPLVHRGCFAVS